MRSESGNRTAIVGAVLALSMVAGVYSRAEEAVSIFNIPAQPLATALVLFSKQSGLAIMAPADLVRDKTAPTVEGKMSPLTALDRLLKGSGLKYLHSPSGALTIAPSGSTEAVGKRRTARRARRCLGGASLKDFSC